MKTSRTMLALGLAAALAASAPAFAADNAGQRPAPAQMAQRHAERMADLKAKLNLSAEQEGAWETFLAASQPPARPPKPEGAADGQRPQPPQGQPPEHGKRSQAAQTFRAQLTAEQQKIFDENYKRGPGRRGGRPPRASE